jgi:hypothetical protein
VFLTKGRPLRFLFAEHFHAEMVYNLLGQLQRQPVADFELVLVSPDEALMQGIQVLIGACRTALLPGVAEKMRYHNTSLLTFAATPAMNVGGKFDYIEYNGGLSKAEDVTAELLALSTLLHEEGGAVGLTYFTRNHHVERVHRLVDARNTSFMVPFSLEATRLVNEYLTQHKLSAFKSDAELVVHLGGEWQPQAYILYKPSDALPRKQWRTYLRAEAKKLVEDAGFVVASWVPSAYSHPFGKSTTITRRSLPAVWFDPFVLRSVVLLQMRLTTMKCKNTQTRACRRKIICRSSWPASGSPNISSRRP